MSDDGQETNVGQQTVEGNSDDGVKNLHLALELNRRKRASKRNTTKIRHQLGILLGTPSSSLDKPQLKHHINSLWSSLEETQNIMDDLSACYLEQKDFVGQKATRKESDELEVECQEAIEKAQAVVIALCSVGHTMVVPPKSGSDVSNKGIDTTAASNLEEAEHVPDAVADLTNQAVLDPAVTNSPDPTSSIALEPSDTYGNNLPASLATTIHSPGATQGPVISSRLKQLKVQTFDGDKTKFEEYWGLFESLVDRSLEPVSLKMARLRQSLSGRALESIRGLGVSGPEYNEAK